MIARPEDRLPSSYRRATRPKAIQSFALPGVAEAGILTAVIPSSGPGITESDAGGVGCGAEFCTLDGITFRAES